MMKQGAKLAVVLLALLALAISTAAQTGIGVRVSAVTEGGIVVYDETGSSTMYALPLTYILDQVWNPAGDKIAVIGSMDADFQVWVIDLAAISAYPIASGVEPFPPLFNSAGDLLFVAPPESLPTSMETPYTVRLMLVTPQADAQPAQIASFAWQVGCGGGSPFPADAAYSTEAGFFGNALALMETPYGYLYSTSCAGVGYGLINPATGEDLPIPNSDNMFRAALSLDGTQLYALYLNPNDANRARPILVRVDLSTLTMTEISTTAMPDQITVGVDGAVFYSSRVESGDLLAGLTVEERARAIEGIGLPADANNVTVPSYTVSIYRVDPVTQAEALVYTGEGYAVGRMTALDADSILFSVIGNQQAFVTEIVQTGAFTGTIPVTVYAMNTDGTGLALIGENMKQFAVE